MFVKTGILSSSTSVSSSELSLSLSLNLLISISQTFHHHCYLSYCFCVSLYVFSWQPHLANNVCTSCKHLSSIFLPLMDNMNQTGNASRFYLVALEAFSVKGDVTIKQIHTYLDWKSTQQVQQLLYHNCHTDILLVLE